MTFHKNDSLAVTKKNNKRIFLKIVISRVKISACNTGKIEYLEILTCVSKRNFFEGMGTSKSTNRRDQFGSSSNSDQESFSSSSSQLDTMYDNASRGDSKEEQASKNPVIPRRPEESLNSESCKMENFRILQNRVKLLKIEKEAILGVLGEIEFMQQRKEREERNSEIFHQIFPSSRRDFKSCSSSCNPRDDKSGAGRTTNPLTPTFRDETDNKSSARQSCESVSFSVQQDDSSERISLSSEPTISVAATLYYNYKLLLLTLPQSLFSSDVARLKNWAREKFLIENVQNATDVLFQLDEKGAINAEDLSQLCDFFKSIVRYDLVHIIEAFVLGDYSLFRLVPRSKTRDAGRLRNSRRFSSYGYDFIAASSSSTAGAEKVKNPATSGKPQNNNEPLSFVAHQIQQAASSSFSVPKNTSNPRKPFSRSPDENQSTARVQQQLNPPATGLPSSRVNEMVVVNGSTALSKYLLKF